MRRRSVGRDGNAQSEVFEYFTLCYLLFPCDTFCYRIVLSGQRVWGSALEISSSGLSNPYTCKQGRAVQPRPSAALTCNRCSFFHLAHFFRLRRTMFPGPHNRRAHRQRNSGVRSQRVLRDDGTKTHERYSYAALFSFFCAAPAPVTRPKLLQGWTTPGISMLS
jgi:hypothetical protein